MDDNGGADPSESAACAEMCMGELQEGGDLGVIDGGPKTDAF